MKRIQQVNNIIGIELKKENGEIIVINESDVLAQGVSVKDGKMYNTTRTNSYIIVCRNTQVYTYYEVLDKDQTKYTITETWTKEEVDFVSEVSELLETIEIPTEEVIEIPAQPLIHVGENEDILSLKEPIEVSNFYDKGFNTVYTIENEEVSCFGFTKDDIDIYIPTGRLEPKGEMCIVYKKEEIIRFVTEEKEIKDKLLEIGYDNKVDCDTFNSYIWEDEITKKYSKIISDEIYGTTDKKTILYVKDNEVTKITRIPTENIDLFTVKRFNVEELGRDNYNLLYKAYKSSKKTKGITDEIKGKLFDYLKF